jgi:hypothetical protein
MTKTELFKGLRERVDLLLMNPGLQKDLINKGYIKLVNLARKNRRLLADFVSRNFSKGAARGRQADESESAFNSKGGAAWAA